ncbi:MAG: GvpL/GvpF family gas vesicle protein [Deltaproteobacteria bacterium]|nr:GvpL/GvpF family gas vesicle protein [Deltaproteobacteria bacterium]
MNGLWLYCIIENRGEMKWNCLGIHGTSAVFVVPGGEFAAVVSEEPMKKYPLVRDYLIAHQKVNETVMQGRSVLPVRFCTMTERKEKIVDEVLVPKAQEFRKEFAEIEGKEEYGLRVRWTNLDRIFREIGETDEKILEKKKKILLQTEAERRIELVDIGHWVQTAIQQKNQAMVDALMAELVPLATRSKKNNTLGDAMILNAAFLLKKGVEPALSAKVLSLDEKYKGLLQFKYVGPVPPFNFVEIVIKWREEPSHATVQGEKNVSVG